MADNDYFDDNDENLILPSQSVFQAYRSSSPPQQRQTIDSRPSYSNTNHDYHSTTKNQNVPHKSNSHSSNEYGSNECDSHYKNTSNVMDIPISTKNMNKSQSNYNNFSSPANKIDRSSKKPFLKKGR